MINGEPKTDKQKLYDALSGEFNLGTYEDFERNIGDSVKRKKLYDAASADYDLGDYESYSKRIGPTHKESLDLFYEEHRSFMNDFETKRDAWVQQNIDSAKRQEHMRPGYQAPAAPYTKEEEISYNDLAKQEAALKKAWYTSDEYLREQNDKAYLLSLIKSQVETDMTQYAEQHPMIVGGAAFVPNPAAATSRGIKEDEEMRHYDTARRIMDETIKLHNAPSKYGASSGLINMAVGAGDALTSASFWTAGLSEIADNLNVRDVLFKVQEKLGNLNDLSEETIEKILSPAEKAVLQAWAINAQTQLDRAADLSRGYQAGIGAIESLGFMAEFALTGGVGKAASEGAETFAKWLGKKVFSSSDEVAGKVAKEAGEGILKKYGKNLGLSLAEAAGRTGVMPSTFRNISEKATEIKTNEEGDNYLVGMTNAFARGLADSFIENLSEGGRVGALGELLGDVAGKVPVFNKLIDKLSNSKAGELWTAFNSSGIMNTLRAGGWHGIGEEYLEEWYGNSLRTLTGVDKDALKEFATWDSQLVTLASFLPLTILGGTVSTAQVVSAKRNLDQKAAALRTALLDRGYDEAQVDNYIDLMRGASPAEISNILSPIGVSVAGKSVNDAAALIKPFGEFAMAVRKWQSFNTKYQYHEQEQRDALLQKMESTLGQFWQEDETGVRKVQRATNSKGETVYILGKQSAKDAEAGLPASVPAIAADGKKIFVNPAEYELDEELDLNTFLGLEIMAEKGNVEKARMIREQEELTQQIKQASAPGTQVNLGTAEAPIIGTIVQRTSDGVIVNTPDGMVRQLTYQELGNYMGINATPLTDAQLDEQEADTILANQHQREAALNQEYEQYEDSAEKLTESENEIAQSVDAVTDLPMDSHGNVDETALWNEDPARWAAWNDEKRQDGGANSMLAINAAITNLSAQITEAEAAYASMPVGTERNAMEQDINAKKERLQALNDIAQSYAVQAEAAAAEEQVKASAANQMSEQQLTQLDEQYEAIYGKTKSLSERARLLQEYLDKIAEGSLSVVVLTRSNYAEAMRNAGCSQRLIDLVTAKLNSMPPGGYISGFNAAGKLFLMVEGLETVDYARRTYVHERQHGFNSQNMSFVRRIVSAMSRQQMLDFIETYAGDAVGEYLNLPDEAIADELICRAMESVYTFEDFSVDLQSRGLPTQVITIINEINDEQRNDINLANSRRRGRRAENAVYSTIGDLSQDGRDSEQVSGGLLGQEAAGSPGYSERGAGDREGGEGAAVDDEINPAFVDATSTDAEGAKFSAKLTDSEIDNLVEAMKANAEVAEDLELTPENWADQFGTDGMVPTPVGNVKMGENQYLKLLQRKRSQYFGMIRPTLVNPDIVLEELSPSENGERDTVLLFIKTFIKPDGGRYVHFESVTIQKDSMEISISSHEIQEEDLKKKMRNDNVAHLRDSLSASEWRLNGRLSDGPDLVPTPSEKSSEGKDSENLETPSDSARFSVITPEMDAEYMAAVERGDMETAQVKSADTVTYDDKGNVIPLSERFNPEKSDIRFSAVRIGPDANQQAEGNVMFSTRRGSLVGMHNISEEKLRKLIKQGGSANPSTAVIDIERQSFDSFGDISLIMPSSLVDAETGRNAGTFTADAWTPTYPQIEKRFSDDNLQRAYWRDITAIPEEMQSEVRMAFDSWLDNRTASGLAYMYLLERGEAPEMVRVAAKYPQEIKDEISAILGEGRTRFYELTDEEKQAVLDLYIQENFGGSREDFDRSIAETIQRIEDRLSTGKVPSFVEKRITGDLQWMKEHGYNYDNISNFVRDIVSDIRHAGEVNAAATTNRALDYIKDNNLSAEYEQWKESLNDRYGIKEYLFDGYTPSGNPRWLPNTVENASKLMNKQGLAGATGMAVSFNRFVATLVPKKKSLSDIRSSKDLLVEDEKLVDDFRDKWSEVFFDLGIKCQPDAKGYEDYGLERLTEAAQKKNPGAYLKKEYGIELSQEDLQRLADMIKAIKTEFPARYFETKFQRPVYLNEFAAAVIPTTTSADIKQAIAEAGLPIFEYDSAVEGSRHEATLKATDMDSIRFSIANENQAIFVSNAAKAVEGIKMEKATPEQWLKMIEKAGGLKAGEDKWMGLSDWLMASDKKTLTKQEVLDFIGEHMIQIEEQHYEQDAEDNVAELHSEMERILQEKLNAYKHEWYEENEDESLYGDPASEYAIEKLREELGDEFPYAFELANGGEVYLTFPYEDDAEMRKWSEKLGLKYDPKAQINNIRLGYTTDGLENRREIALTVPTIEYWNESDITHFGDAGEGRAVAWIRFGETTTESGERVLVIDEIQSKRHQEGREKGYVSSRIKEEMRKTAEDAKKAFSDYESVLKEKYGEEFVSAQTDDEIMQVVTREEYLQYDRLRDAYYDARLDYSNPRYNAVPDAPFDKNWHELAMKRMLRYAAENGYDMIAWTTGDQQAERYDIGGEVESIERNRVGDNQIMIHIFTKSGRNIIIIVDNEGKDARGNEDFLGKSLSEILGKEMADKVLNAADGTVLEGEGLKVGGEGMRGFYDKMLPSFMNKYGKKWGVKVEDIELPNLGEDGLTMHSIPVTEEMKESVMEGQVMFSAVQIDPAVRQEMDTIKAKAMWDGTFMKAPNGADTKLTEDQWLLVRTNNFKNWFGDWENDPGNASKIVDENGEPMVMYHGSAWEPLMEPKGKAVFRMNDGLLGKGAYFSNELAEATLYAEIATDLDTTEEGNYELLQDKYVTDYFLNVRNEEDIFREGNDMIAVAKSPSQIKSATETTGEFSESDDIRFSSRFDVNTNPTEAQKKAGNYKMGHLRLDGYNITIENPKGSVRRGTDSKGNEWENVLNNDYGYIRGTKGVDGDHIDVYLSDNPEEGNVFVIDQVNPNTGAFDEHKVMYGFESMDQAREAYLANFSEGWNGLGTITEVTKDEFRKWIDSSHRKTKPFSEYKSVKAEGAQSEGYKEEDITYSVFSTPTDEIVAEGMKLSVQDFAKLAGNIFTALPEAARKEAIEDTFKRNWDMQSAIFQIPARLAEKESWRESDKELAQIIRDKVQEAIEESGVVMTRPLTPKEALWMLYRSTEATSNSMMDTAKRSVVANNLGFDKATLAQEEEAGEAVRFSAVTNADINAKASMYNQGAVNVLTRLKEAFVDMFASVEELVGAIEKKTGKKAQAFENILLALNQQASRGLAAMETYEQNFLKPMFDEIRKIMNETGYTYEDIVRYVILKHGLERNEKLAQRDARAYYQEIYDDIIAKIKGMTAAQKRTYLTNAQLKDADAKAELASLQAVDTSSMSKEEKVAHKKAIANAQRAVDEAAEYLEKAQKIATMSEQEAEDELQKHFDAIAAQVDTKFNEFRQKDYSGISSMFYDRLGVDRNDYATEEEYQSALMDAKKHKYKTLEDIEKAAEAEVKLFEKAVKTEDLWKRINAATKETLRQQYEANMISKEQYDNLRGMFEYYVPLRGFKDNTAEDMYTYYRKPNSTGYTKPILAAEGRKTEAESPFGWIAAMAGSAIASNVKNEAKLALYYFVANRPDNDIATISKTWYVHTPGDVDENGRKIFKPAYPTFQENLSTEEAKTRFEQWQEQMKELQKQGLAYESGQKINLGNAVVNISDANKPEHIVRVKIAGNDYTIIINGNPRAAQAINGDINIEGTDQDYNTLFGPVLRWMSSVNTSYNPEFWITNMMRDMAFTWMAVDTKESPEYKRRFRENYRKAFRVIQMVAKKEKGELGDSYLEKMYEDFVANGGVTGYTQIKDSETWEKEIENYLASNNPESIRSGKIMRGVKNFFHAAHRFGESLEQVSRFAAFLTSREMGKPMGEAINDAKEITVNFNRKGTGKRITLEEAKHLTDRNGKPLSKFMQWVVAAISWLSPIGRRFIMFFNAAIQGLNAAYKLYKANPSRMVGWMLAYTALGMMNSIIHALTDDDDDYLDIPQYERRNSLMIGWNGVYFKWALPQEARVFYALGDLTVESIMGRNPHQNVIVEALKTSAEILPINPTEGWKALAPSALVPAIELLINEDYKGDAIYNDMKWLSKEERDRTAKWSNAMKGTGKSYVLISQGLNNLTGGDEYDAGFINIQPEMIEHIVQSSFGGTIRTADKFFTTIMAMIDPEEDLTVRQTPFLNRILTVNDERYRNVHVNDVFEYYRAEAEHAIRLEKQYTAAKDSKALRDLRESDEYKWAKIYNRHKKALEKIQDKIREAEGTRDRKDLIKRQDELKKTMIKEFSEIR